MKTFPIVGILFFAGILVVAAARDTGQSGSGAEKPNILLITVDTLRADHLSSYGYHLKTSPRIDRLASEGVRFKETFTVIPLTGPSHLSLFTSRYPQEHGARINGTALPKDSKWLSLPQILRRFGYRNAAFISSWTLNSRLTQLNRWFEVYDEKLTRTYQVFNSSRYAEDVTPLAVRWLEKRASPFFLWLHYFDPHSPYHLRQEFASPESSGNPGPVMESRDQAIRNRIRKYDSEIGYADHYIGKVLDKLDTLGLRDSTMVVLTSDHGESLGEHGYVGHGRHLFEGIIRIPLIVRYPGKIPAGKVIEEKVSLLDVTPTILEMALPEQNTDKQLYSFAGRSLAPAVLGDEKIPDRPMRYVAFAGRKGFAPGWLSWMWVQKAQLPLHVGKTEGSRKLIWTPEGDSLAVFDIDKDPLELKPLDFEQSDAEYKRETAALERWFESTDLVESDSKLSKRDAEVLKSLGYIQ